MVKAIAAADAASAEKYELVEAKNDARTAHETLECHMSRTKAACDVHMNQKDADGEPGVCHWVTSDEQRYCMKDITNSSFDDEYKYDAYDCLQINQKIDDMKTGEKQIAKDCTAIEHCRIVQQKEHQFCAFIPNDDMRCRGQNPQKCKMNAACDWDNEEQICNAVDNEAAHGCNGYSAKKCSDKGYGMCKWDAGSSACQEANSVDCYDYFTQESCSTDVQEKCAWIPFVSECSEDFDGKKVASKDDCDAEFCKWDTDKGECLVADPQNAMEGGDTFYEQCVESCSDV